MPCVTILRMWLSAPSDFMLTPTPPSPQGILPSWLSQNLIRVAFLLPYRPTTTIQPNQLSPQTSCLAASLVVMRGSRSRRAARHAEYVRASHGTVRSSTPCTVHPIWREMDEEEGSGARQINMYLLAIRRHYGEYVCVG